MRLHSCFVIPTDFIKCRIQPRVADDVSVHGDGTRPSGESEFLQVPGTGEATTPDFSSEQVGDQSWRNPIAEATLKKCLPIPLQSRTMHNHADCLNGLGGDTAAESGSRALALPRIPFGGSSVDAGNQAARIAGALVSGPLGVASVFYGLPNADAQSAMRIKPEPRARTITEAFGEACRRWVRSGTWAHSAIQRFGLQTLRAIDPSAARGVP